MTSEKTAIARDVRWGATLAPGYAPAWRITGWRTLGIFCLQLCLFWAVTAIASPAQDEQQAIKPVTFTTLFNFDYTNGAGPTGNLVQGTDGNLYGTTDVGGSNRDGTVFKITPAGTLTTLHNFDGTDGSVIFAGLALGTDGNFYGTAEFGGTSTACGPGCGTVFKITPGGIFNTLHDFDATDGNYPGPLIQGGDGNFYGMTGGGGANGTGTVFKITPNGTLTTLYSFCSESGCADGSYPNSPAALVQGTDGNFYGTTFEGGTADSGTVFKITPTGTLTSLYSFCTQPNCVDGSGPYAGLVRAADGNFYGTTEALGANGQGGTIFKITSGGVLTTLYSFCSRPNCIDGFQPTGPLLQATDGNFYGMTVSDGPNGSGTVFRITSGGSFTVLQNPPGTADTGFDAFFQGTNGNLYSPTYGGGTNGDGTIYSLSVGLGPFVETLPASGKPGSLVKILSTNLTGATGVSFNGVAAVYNVVSKTLISATVPTGATTGFVTVTTPSGTLKSNVKFRVRP